MNWMEDIRLFPYASACVSVCVHWALSHSNNDYLSHEPFSVFVCALFVVVVCFCLLIRSLGPFLYLCLILLMPLMLLTGLLSMSSSKCDTRYTVKYARALLHNHFHPHATLDFSTIGRETEKKSQTNKTKHKKNEMKWNVFCFNYVASSMRRRAYEKRNTPMAMNDFGIRSLFCIIMMMNVCVRACSMKNS